VSVASRVVELTDDATRIDNAGASGRQSGQTIAITNEGDGTAYLGGPDVTEENGWPLAEGEKIALDLTRSDELYAVADTTATLRCLDTSV
jgi:hypothetical protein